jgi:hypothetical protein
MMVLMCFIGGLAAQDKKDPPKTTVIKLDQYQSTIPDGWKVEKPANLLRLYQLRLSKAEGDPSDAEVVVMENVKGTVEANFARWKETLIPPDDAELKNHLKEEKFKLGKAEVAVLDAWQVAWVYKDRPFDPKSKEEIRPNQRIVWVIFSTDDGNYLIRLSGPNKTVTGYRDTFDKWLRAFKATK